MFTSKFKNKNLGKISVLPLSLAPAPESRNNRCS